jgi:hypothetical protein
MPDQSSIEVLVQLEQNDLTRASMDIALGRFTPYKWVTLGISAALLSAMFAVVFFPQIMRSPVGWLEILLVGLVGLISWPAVLVVAIRLNSKKAAKSLLQSTPSLQGPTHWLFSDDGIRVDSPTASSHIEWRTYVRVRETETQFLLYPQTQFAHVIPKRFFSTKEHVNSFRQMIRRSVATATLQAE